VAYNNVISRTDAASLIPEEVSRDMIATATTESAVLSMFRKVPVGRNQVRMPVLSTLPVAYWVGGDTGLKQTTELNWANKFLNVEEIAVIVPVPDNVLADAEVNIWDEAMPYLVEAFGRTLDSAVFFGTNAPGSFPTNISAASAAAGNTVTEAATAANGGFWGDLDNTIGKVEEDGFDVNGFVAARNARGKLRAARNTQGDRLDAGRLDGALSQIDGLPVTYPMRGLFPSGGSAGTNVRLFAGDWSQFVVGVRQDISIKILTEAVIQDNTGAIMFNLAQQDMTAVRLTFRVGWQVANLVNNDQPTEANRYPVARQVF
jgi:HK97 family phage major capsid protein